MCQKTGEFGYFGKLPKDMNDYESTLLAGIPILLSGCIDEESETCTPKTETGVREDGKVYILTEKEAKAIMHK